MCSVRTTVIKSESDPPGHALPMSIIDFMRFPGEIRNSIYNFVICGLPRTSTVSVLPAIAYTSTYIHQEFMSKYLPRMHLDITTMHDIWQFYERLDAHSGYLRLHSITRLTITNFTTIAHTQTRANEVMDFLFQFTSLKDLVLDVSLGDLHHGFQGRIKDVEHILTEFELSRLLSFSTLRTLVIRIRPDGVSHTPASMTLLGKMMEVFKAGIGVGVTCVHSQ